MLLFKKYKVNRESLKRVLKGKQQTTYSKLHEKKIHFRYITISSGARKPVICLNNQQYFLTLTGKLKKCIHVCRRCLNASCGGDHYGGSVTCLDHWQHNGTRHKISPWPAVIRWWVMA